jgi:hypothetical protein
MTSAEKGYLKLIKDRFDPHFLLTIISAELWMESL